MMRRGVIQALAVLAMALPAGCFTAHAKPVIRGVAAAPPPSGEQTQPLAIAYGGAVDPGRALPSPIDRALPAQLSGAAVAAANGTAYYYDNGELTALDLPGARVRWHRAVDAYASLTVGSDDGFTATAHSIVFQSRPDGDLVSLDAATGATQFSLPHARAGGAIDGVLFAGDYSSSPAYLALDEKTGQRLWKSYGGGGQVFGAPLIRNGVLLQPFVDDGAILEDAIYAFDPKTGHAKWRTYVMEPPPLGYRGGIAYVNGTWFPEQMDNYVPLTVEAVDLATGKRLDSYTYAPDPQRNSATYRSTPMQAYVTGGYVYLRVNGLWYRYDADREPLSAHPSNLPGVEIAAAFDRGTLLVTQNKRTFIAHGEPERMTLRPLPNGELRSAVVTATGGVRYALVGTLLYRFDSVGTPSAIGSANCAHGANLYPWPGKVAVICDGHELLFTDATPRVPALALAPRHAPPGHLQLNAFGIAPPRAGFDKQWTVGPIVPWQHGGVVMWLDRGAMNLAGSIGFVSRDGQMTTVPIGKDIIPPRPPSPVPGVRVPPLRMQPRVDWPPKATTIVYDTSGNVWFNNVWDPSIWRLDSSGRVTSTLVGVRTPPFRGGLAIRLALGPDGQAWFARSHPTKEIARADGSASITIPDRFGDALILARAPGGFWFVSQTQLVHVTFSGAFTATPLPAQLQNVRTYPGLRVASAGDSIWIANGAYIARMNERGVLAHYELPDATLGVYTMVTGCDGSLYVAENAPEVLRLPPGGKSLERYPIRYRQLDGLTSTSDCTIWFVEGTGMPGGEQGVGTLQLIR